MTTATKTEKKATSKVTSLFDKKGSKAKAVPVKKAAPKAKPKATAKAKPKAEPKKVASIAEKKPNSKAGRLTMLASLHEQGAFYEVLEVDNLYPKGKEIVSTGRKTLINGDTLNPISVMSTSYQVVQNKEIFTALDKQIAKSGLDLKGAYTKVDKTPDGSRVAVQYVFPAHSVDVGSKGDTTSLMITAINSFNGSTCFFLYLGGFRSYCMNTQVFGTTFIQYKKQHTKDLNIEEAAKVIGNGIDVFNTESKAWIKMFKTKATEDQAFKALSEQAKVKGGYKTYKEYLDNYKADKKRTTKLENYMGVWEKYKKELGSTEFALYNTITEIATHGATKSGEGRKQAIRTFKKRTERASIVCKKHLTVYKALAA